MYATSNTGSPRYLRWTLRKWTGRSQRKGVVGACLVLLIFTVFSQTAGAQTEANKAVIERWAELWKTADLTIADEIFASDFVGHIPHYPGASDLEGYKAEVTKTPTYVTDFDLTIDDTIAEGDKVAGRFSAAGVMQPMGVAYTNTWIIMFRFTDGKIAEEWWEYDLLGVQQQMGAIPPTRESYTWGEPSAVTGDAGDPLANKVTVLRVVEDFWNRKNAAALDETHAAELVSHIPVIPGHPLNFEAYKQASLVHVAAFPDVHVTADAMIAEGDKVAVRWTLTGTHRAELMGIPALGNRATWTGMTIHRFADGKIVENWWAYDALGMMQQITTDQWSLAGSWHGTNNLGHAIALTITPLGPDNERFAGTLDIAHDPSFGGMFPGVIAATNMHGTYVKTGLNTYAFTMMSYGLGEPAEGQTGRQVIYIQVVSGQSVLTDADTQTAALYTAALYAPDQDPFGDDPPAYGCFPVSGTYKRVPVAASCELPPVPPGE